MHEEVTREEHGRHQLKPNQFLKHLNNTTKNENEDETFVCCASQIHTWYTHLNESETHSHYVAYGRRVL